MSTGLVSHITKWNVLLFGVISLTFLFSAFPLQAMAATGTVNGEVRNNQGAGLSDVQVNFISASTGNSLNAVVTDATGLFSVQLSEDDQFFVSLRDPSGMYFSAYVRQSGGGDSDLAGAGIFQASRDGPLSLGSVNLDALTGSIVGTVVAAESTTPLPSIAVTFLAVGSGNFLGSILTDENGGFEHILPVGQEFIVRFDDSSGKRSSFFYGGVTLNEATIVRLEAGTVAAMEDLGNIVLNSSNATVEGSVNSEIDGTFLEDILVSVIDISTGDSVGSTLSDGNGKFMLQVHTGRTYIASFIDSSNRYLPKFYGGDSTSTAQSFTIEVNSQSPSAQDLSVQMVLNEEPPGDIQSSIQGTVADVLDVSQGLTNITVTFFNAATGLAVTSVLSDANGDYRQDLPAPADYILRFSDHNGMYGSEFSVDSGTIVEALPIALSAEGGVQGLKDSLSTIPGAIGSGMIDGELVRSINDADMPAPNLDVTFIDQTTLMPVVATKSDILGMYSQRLPAPAKYLIRISDPADSIKPQLIGGGEADSFALDSAQTLIDFFRVRPPSGSAEAPSSLSTLNQLTVVAKQPGLGQDPLPGVDVTVVNTFTLDFRRQGVTDSSGRVTFSLPTPSTYLVLFSDSFGRVECKLLGNIYNCYESESEVSPGKTKTVFLNTESEDPDGRVVSDLMIDNNSLISGQGMVTGMVKHEISEAPLAGISVLFLDPNTGSIAATATTDASGSYSQTLSAPGSYVVVFSDSLGTYETEVFPEVHTISEATVVQVEPNGVVNSVNGTLAESLTVPETATIQGTVHDKELAPIVGIIVTFFDSSTGKEITSAATDLTGSFVQVLPAPGDYMVRWSDPAEVGPYQLAFLNVAENFQRVPIHLEPGSIENLSIELPLAVGTIRGVVRDRQQQPLSNMMVRVFDSTYGKSVANGLTDQQGQYDQVLSLPENYIVQFSDPGQQGPYQTSFFGGEQQLPFAERIELIDPQLEVQVDKEMLLNLGTIDGHVRDRDFNPIVGITVSFFDAQSFQLVSSTVTNENGNYAQALSIPGTYLVRFSDPSNIGSFAIKFAGGEFVPDAEQFVLAEAGTQGHWDAELDLVLSLQPMMETVHAGLGALQFTAQGGTAPFTYQFVTNQSGATIDANTGFYEAGSTPGSDVIEVRDARANIAQATIVVLEPSPPTITRNVSGTLGNNGWYVSNVTVTWEVDGNGLEIISSTGCDPSTVDFDTFFEIITCEATSGGGTTSQLVGIQRDATPPTVNLLSPPDGATFFLNQQETVSWTATDATGVILPVTATAPDDSVLDTFSSGGKTFSLTATDVAGNVTSVKHDYTVEVFMCDTNQDFVVDRSDIMRIFGSRNLPAMGEDDPRDRDGDGTITVIDGRLCVLECTNPGCASQP